MSERGSAPRKRNWWVWISAALTVVAAGLLIWGLATRAELDDAQQENEALRAQVEQGKEAGGAALAEAEQIYDDVMTELGATREDLAAAEQDVKASSEAAEEAEQAAADAQAEVDAAGDETDRAEAEAAHANAELEAAQARATVVADCVKAYGSAIGLLFEGEDPSAQAPVVREQLAGITAECRAAMADA
jgi:hypothetical protein